MQGLPAQGGGRAQRRIASDVRLPIGPAPAASEEEPRLIARRSTSTRRCEEAAIGPIRVSKRMARDPGGEGSRGEGERSTPSMGRCERCGARASRSGMAVHLRRCVPAEGATFVHLRVHGSASPDYWLDLAVDPTATLKQLDQFLRRLWLECCGHLSCFRIDAIQFSSLIDRTFAAFGPPERSMGATVGEVFTRRGQRARYDYDFGSTTELSLSVAGARVVASAKPRLQLLARNEPPIRPCAICRQPAALICAICLYEGEPFVCDEHARAHGCGQEGLLPVVNSPRMGTCGYTGPLR